jgi:hypothetical protein
MATVKASALRSCMWVSVAVLVATADPFARQAPPPPATAPAAGSQQTFRLYMPDGQLRSHKLRVYVEGTILLDQNPRLTLLRSHAGTEAAAGEEKPIPASLAVPGQQWTETVDGLEIHPSGTILLFDGSKVPFGLRPMVRVVPDLQWTENGTERRVLQDREINVADIRATIVWTLLVAGVTTLIIVALAWRTGSGPVLLLTGVDGHLSLAQAQVACWTIAVGCMVLGYGIVRRDIPDIPSSLLVLMGASLATGGLAYFKDAEKQEAAVALGVEPVQRAWAWGDLVRTFSPVEPPQLSLAKAQMLFWTVLLLVLFVSKSILDGAIWAVPWPLVALMGFSQAGYLAPKLAPVP